MHPRAWFPACVAIVVIALGASVATKTTLATASALPAVGSRPIEGPGLYVSWHQPFGSVGASDSLNRACGDTSWVDTLYLSFEVPRPTPGLATLNAAVYFHPQAGDTMGAFWHFKTGWENGGNMWVDLQPYVTLPGNAPWGEVGYYELNYDHRSGWGRLDIEYVVPPDNAIALEPGRRYTFARVRLLHRRAELSGCAQPICVEWASARLRFTTTRQMDLPLAGSRFVSINDLTGATCASARGKTRAKPWSPKP